MDFTRHVKSTPTGRIRLKFVRRWFIPQIEIQVEVLRETFHGLPPPRKDTACPDQLGWVTLRGKKLATLDMRSFVEERK